MAVTDVEQPPLTTLTYAHDGRIARFEGVVDATNLEIFRDFLAMLPSAGDVVIAVDALDLRVPQAAAMIVDRARTLGRVGRLVIDAGPSSA